MNLHPLLRSAARRSADIWHAEGQSITLTRSLLTLRYQYVYVYDMETGSVNGVETPAPGSPANRPAGTYANLDECKLVRVSRERCT